MIVILGCVNIIYWIFYLKSVFFPEEGMNGDFSFNDFKKLRLLWFCNHVLMIFLLPLSIYSTL